jgi:hypothetical protein
MSCLIARATTGRVKGYPDRTRRVVTSDTARKIAQALIWFARKPAPQAGPFLIDSHLTCVNWA